MMRSPVPRPSSCSLVTLFLFGGLLAGCGGAEGLPKGERGTVSGTVKYNGAPVPAGCTVLFQKSGGGFVASGTTDAEGKYSLSMRGETNILAGTYSVGISPPVADAGLSPDEIMKRQSEGKPIESPKAPFPEKYTAAETAGLSREVKAGANTIDLELTN